MNNAQLAAIQRLTRSMLDNAPFPAGKTLVFTIQPALYGYNVLGQTVPEFMGLFEKPYMVIATVGPRGGVKHLKEYN